MHGWIDCCLYIIQIKVLIKCHAASIGYGYKVPMSIAVFLIKMPILMSDSLITIILELSCNFVIWGSRLNVFFLWSNDAGNY